MSRIAYVNGRYVPRRDAAVPAEDRGFLFGDGVYEVCELRDGALVDEERHLDRFENSLAAIRMAAPMPRRALQAMLRELVRRNRVREGMVYWQATRGAARRDHAFPPAGTRLGLVAFVTAMGPARRATARAGVAVAIMPDIRWGRCDIKSLNLLPNILAKQAARDAGAYEAWLVDPAGFITEGASTTAWIVTSEGHIVTRPLGPEILPGVTRAVILEAARTLGMPVSERAFTVAEARAAVEAFLSASSALIVPVVRIDGQQVGNGAPGPVTGRLRDAARTTSVLSGRHLPNL